MDRLNQLRGEAGSSRDSTLDTTSPPSEAFMTANESSSKYFSLSEVDSTFDISPIKDVSLPSTTITTDSTITDSDDQLISNLSPIGKKSDLLDSYKIGKQIEAGSILSGGVDIFDDNDNSYDGDELIIDDNVDMDDKSNSEIKESESVQFKDSEDNAESTVVNAETATESKDTEVVLQIDGKNVDAIDIGNGLYLYRKEGQEELAAVQIIDDDQHQPSFKFLKVRENAEGNLEVYEEIQIEVPKEVPSKQGKSADMNVSHVPIKDINKVMSDHSCSKVVEKSQKMSQNEEQTSTKNDLENELNKESQSDTRTELNVNGKMVKFSEARKSPLIGSFTPMTYHSTPNKEGIPLTKTMVDQQLHPNRHSDNVKKTIEVHTDSSKQRALESQNRLSKSIFDENKSSDCTIVSKESEKSNENNDKDSNLKSLNTIPLKSENQIPNENKNIEEVTKISAEVIDNKISESIDKMEQTVNAKKSTNESEQSTNTQEKIAVDRNKAQDKEVANTEVSLVGQLQQENKLNNFKQSDNSNIISCNDSDNRAVTSDNALKENSENIDITTDNKIQDKKQNILVTEDRKEGKATDTFERNKPVSEPTETLMKQPDEQKLETKIIPKQEDIRKDKSKDDAIHKSSVVDLTGKTQESSNSSLNKNELESKPITDGPELHLPNESPQINTTITETLDTATVKPAVKKISDTHVSTSVVDESIKIVHNKTELKEHCNNDSKDKQLDTKVVSPIQNISQTKTELIEKKDTPKVHSLIQKPINNNHSGVPFGKWTEANRQEFLNKIKESRIPTNSSNGKQIKNSNDLNRRDVLKKIDSQRQSNIATAKAHEGSGILKSGIKKETQIFTNKLSSVQDATKTETDVKMRPILMKNPTKQENVIKSLKEIPDTTTFMAVDKKESTQRKEINNQHLIDKTIEGIINRGVPNKLNTEEVSQESLENDTNTLDDIEVKMNKIHGISLVEKSQPEVSSASSKQAFKSYSKTDSDKSVNKHNRMPNLLPFINKTSQKNTNDNLIDNYSEEEIIEHEPITGDIEPNKNILIKSSTKETIPLTESLIVKSNKEDSKMESIITEKDFDKFARRNSITYENCLKVNFDGGESPNVIKTVVEKDNALVYPKHNKNETKRADNKIISTQKLDTYNHHTQSKNTSTTIKFGLSSDVSHKSCPSKVKMAYQSVMTAKRHLERPFTIIEDKPVKVVYMDTNAEYIPTQLNVQGKELTSTTKQYPIIDTNTHSSCDSLDSDLMETIEEGKSQDDVKIKSKHQRKQVLTPVETPELELIEPEDLGFDISPKKKRKTDESKIEKNAKAIVPKKSYLLGRSPTTVEDKVIQLAKPFDVTKNLKDYSKPHEPHPRNKNTVSAIDNLVMAAALIETQAENIKSNIINVNNSDNQSNTPVKRGRGRPRKYPLPEIDSEKNKNLSPQKKSRVSTDEKIDASIRNMEDDSSDDEVVRENWTMGKINENIVCPICGKLFRSENVVFKHVKHCTGPSPNRSESDKRRSRQSQDSETKDDEIESKNNICQKETSKKQESKDSPKHILNKDDVILIEDTPIKDKSGKREVKQERKVIKSKTFDKDNLVCEFCGKTFRQLSYLVSHKLQHGKDDLKKNKPDSQPFKSVFSCEVCKKEFRKLHHLVQHRIIHNSNSNMTARLSRKYSSERNEHKIENDQKTSKHTEDPSAGFRCEPCDKSFRKLHHLVEHRETHDGINRQKSTSSTQINYEKSNPPSQCEICKKTFRKLQHLIEHKQQHLETNLEKSDNKNLKSSLSAKDIIHECSLCYMVFPNEHSLNKHTIICQRKKKQSAAKQLKQIEKNELNEDSGDVEESKQETITEENSDVETVEDKISSDKEIVLEKNSTSLDIVDNVEIANVTEDSRLEEKILVEPENEVILHTEIENDENNVKTENDTAKPAKDQSETLTKDAKTEEREILKNQNTPKRKLVSKEKVQPTITKRHKTINAPLPIISDDVQSVISSDDDEIRYMLNPNFKSDTPESKLFMKVRAKKRNSLQIERPNSKDLVKRRISLQHPPKVPRLKSKSIENKDVPVNTPNLAKTVVKPPALDPVPSTDSDDSDIKYSFPKTVVEKTSKSVSHESPKKDKKIKRKPLEEKRKSLTNIARRKSQGKIISAKSSVKPLPIKPIKRRTAEIEHRCDCGQLFNSAALLSRHTTVAHTPPRIRRRRSPPPEVDNKTVTKSAPNKSSVAGKSRKSVDLRKSSVTSNSATATMPDKATRKSNVNKSDAKTPNRKSIKSGDQSSQSGVSSTKPRRGAAHRGVPVPEKMRKLMERKK